MEFTAQKTTITVDGAEYTRPVLTFATERAAEKGNRLISFAMGLDMRGTIRWDTPKACLGTSRWYINHPAQQVADPEKLAEVMDYVDGETVAEFDAAWIPPPVEMPTK